MARVHRTLGYAIMLVAATAFAGSTPSAKSIVLQMYNHTPDGPDIRVVLAEVSAEDESLTPLELLRKAAPNEPRAQSGFYFGGVVYRLDRDSHTWKKIYGGTMGPHDSLRVRDLLNGDVLVLHHPLP